jgi:hypothetical protein
MLIIRRVLTYSVILGIFLAYFFDLKTSFLLVTPFIISLIIYIFYEERIISKFLNELGIKHINEDSKYIISEFLIKNGCDITDKINLDYIIKIFECKLKKLD